METGYKDIFFIVESTLKKQLKLSKTEYGISGYCCYYRKLIKYEN
ncbi:MAG: hypothetical protein UR43_C0013G0017 [candidate division TM6 bacterium GW2011_GWF2_33_332]|nr:MAG: hypothetical protein UR43_C0013G0017 [candidate division TM6 bacterium GW2011_GWF2_33_332]